MTISPMMMMTVIININIKTGSEYVETRRFKQQQTNNSVMLIGDWWLVIATKRQHFVIKNNFNDRE